MAMEHVGIKDIPVDAKPIPPVVPPIEKPKTTAEPTVDKSEKPKEAPKTTAEPTEDESEKSKEAPKTTAEPTEDEGKKPKEASKTTAEPTDDGKENEKSTTTAEPTETPEEAGKRMADGILASIRANQNKEEVSKKIGPELISTLNTLNLDQDTQNSINKVLVEQNFNLVLDSGRSLVDFTFDRVNITSDRIGKQEIVNIEVS